MDKPLRLLLVEDSRADAALIVNELRMGGFNVAHRRVDVAEEFSHAVTERDWDLVICDHGLPQFNSFAALALLNRLGRAIPLIIVSGVISEDDAVGGMRAGAKDYITKGNLRRLVPAVQRELSEARIRQMHIQAAADVKVRLIDVIENLNETFALFDADDRLILCNSRFMTIYGIEPSVAKPGVSFEALMHAHVASGMVPDADGREQEWVRRRTASHRAPGTDFERTLRGGRRLLVSERRTRDGGIVMIGTDVTAARQAQEELHQAQKMEAIGQLTGGIAHDFNNLLTAIILSSEVLGELIPDRKLLLLVDTMRAAAERGADLTGRLLAFGRRQLLEPQPTDVNGTIAGIEQLMRTLGEHIEILITPAEELWTAKVDRGQLEAVILNLAVNARDAMPRGGQLKIETANVEIRRGDKAADTDVAPGDYIMVAVHDTGTGMAPDVAARAFEPFFTTKEVGKGTGLGLSMAHGFVKQSGGSIGIESVPDRGTVVRFYLPRTHAAVAEPDGIPAAPVEAIARQHTILLVEDDDLVRGSVETVLRALGYAIVTAKDGATALDTLGGDSAIDLLLTDFVMPGGLDGLALAIKARELRPGLKVCLASGYRHEAGDIPAELDISFIAKPFRRGTLGLLLRQMLEPGTAVMGQEARR